MPYEDWDEYPNESFLLEGRTLIELEREVRKLLDAQRLDFDQLRDCAQRMSALLDKAEGPIRILP